MRQASKTVTKTAADVLRQKEKVRYQVFRVTCLRAMDRQLGIVGRGLGSGDRGRWVSGCG